MSNNQMVPKQHNIPHMKFLLSYQELVILFNRPRHIENKGEISQLIKLRRLHPGGPGLGMKLEKRNSKMPNEQTNTIEYYLIVC